MTTGRPPKPTKVKQLQGNPGKRALNKREPQPEGDAPRPPYGFKKRFPLAYDIWNQVVDAMEHTGVLTAADAAAVRLASHHYELAIKAVATLRQEGLTRLDENGIERKNPHLQIFRDNSRLFLQYADRMGWNPSARARLKTEPDAEQLSLADLLFEVIGDE